MVIVLIIFIFISASLLILLVAGLGLQQKELKILKDTFDKIDDEKEGCVTSEKLYTVLEKKGYHQNSFSTKVYQLIDMEGKTTFPLSLRDLSVT